MKYKLLSLFALILLISFHSVLKSQNGSKFEALPPGYPDRSATMDAYPGFKNPPTGYGEVSFYWWLGDTLTKERITWQLDQLAGKSITGLQVNYAHSDEGGNIWGLTYPGQPKLFSKDWWDLFSWFLQEAKKRNMSVSLSDYTLGIAGQGWFVDEMLKENPDLYGSRLLARIYDIKPELDTLIQMPDNLITVSEFQVAEGQVLLNTGSPLSNIKQKELHLVPSTNARKVVLVAYETVKTSFDPMNPLSGKKVIEKFFQPFEDHCPGEAGKGLNFFFSDELNFGISGLLWNTKFASEFQKRKGYDIVPELPGLFIDIGQRTPKIRLDFNDVLVALSEEGFFRQIYQWHTDRGMLYGCDHGGRGLDVTEFGDYFRAQRWMSGPGCDQPVLSRNINKNKVASSISHLYERPRTWLEGYHSSGWGTSSAQVADATFANFAMGQNLLSLHGLYYSTHGGWWEWAPPDNHFRQPYWEVLGDFLKCSERLSYLLSQGYHSCDVAILYPVAPMIAGMTGNEAVAAAFETGNLLYSSGIDFDFIDFESLNRAQTKSGELQVSGEKYKVLVLPAMTAIRYSTLEKARDFCQAGGIVIATGGLPVASDRIGKDDPAIQEINLKIFGVTADGISGKERVVNSRNPFKGTGIYLEKPEMVTREVSRLVPPDFKVYSDSISPYILHRKIGKRNLYYVYGVPKDTVCFFRCSGNVELWNPWTGSASPLPVLSSNKSGTRIKMPLNETDPQLIVFSPGDPVVNSESEDQPVKHETLLVGDWEFELKPTLDNQWGDYRQPPYTGFVSADAHKLRYKLETTPDPGWQSAVFNDAGWALEQVSFGPQFLKLGPLISSPDSLKLESKLIAMQAVNPDMPVTMGNMNYRWSEYEFSWRWGLKGNVGRQGYHGLKEWIHDDIIQTGNAVRDWPGVPSPRLVADEKGSTCYLWSTVISDQDQTARIKSGGLEPSGLWVNGNKVNLPVEKIALRKGNNPILIKYSAAGTGWMVFERAESRTAEKSTIPLASNWYCNTSVMPYNCMPGVIRPTGWFRFKAPPGLRSIELASIEKPQLWVNGREVQVDPDEPLTGIFTCASVRTWIAVLPKAASSTATVAVRLPMKAGYFGGAAIPDPIRLNCGRGMIRIGNLEDDESLKTYSGGMWYRKTISLTPDQSGARKVTLDLGDLVSSAEVIINGQSIGRRLTPPWRFDVTDAVRPGENRIEVLIYNTLGNYYLTNPTSFAGNTRSGLIGPVKLVVN